VAAVGRPVWCPAVASLTRCLPRATGELFKVAGSGALAVSARALVWIRTSGIVMLPVAWAYARVPETIWPMAGPGGRAFSGTRCGLLSLPRAGRGSDPHERREHKTTANWAGRFLDRIPVDLPPLTWRCDEAQRLGGSRASRPSDCFANIRLGSNLGSILRVTERYPGARNPINIRTCNSAIRRRCGWGPGGRRFKSCLPDRHRGSHARQGRRPAGVYGRRRPV
jgi:hypothetical protein